MAQFPKFVYVKQEQDGDTSYFVTDEDFEGLAELGETIKVAKYQRVLVGTVGADPVFQAGE